MSKWVQITDSVSFGTDDFIEVSDASPLDITGNLTIEGWFKYAAIPAANNLLTLVCKGTDNYGSEANYSFSITDADKLDFRFYTGASRESVSSATLGDAASANWHHYAVTYDDTANEVKFYRDGVQLGTTQTENNSLTTNALKLYLGWSSNQDSRTDAANVKMSNVRIWNTTRTLAEISANYLKPIASAPGLVWSSFLNEGTGTSVADEVNANNGTFGTSTNAPSWSTDNPTLEVVGIVDTFIATFTLNNPTSLANISVNVFELDFTLNDPTVIDNPVVNEPKSALPSWVNEPKS